ncbi:hypothetical protein Q9R08_05230 [Microbacterium sp. QXD-8]|uniref:Gp28/Gp37-like domain-containing protein n=1 Tax=Microbacterium psychrotolerans TaxID=3068321 RepID=A0ABU0Z0N1_9MICO|nr:hypothetical protein [Microbacterium sp. QXD-8]MDQ7877376.1 hypothetical protein [Microbacterium sp. QXD-8]
MRREYLLAEVMDGDREFVRQVKAVESRASLRWNAASTAHLTVKDIDPVIPDLLADGARAAVWMITEDGGSVSQERLLEGGIGDVSGEGPKGTVTFPVVDDFDMLNEILGWQAPTAPITGQSAAEYARYTGSSETRAKAAIQANVTRLGLPWTVAASLDRGSDGRTEFRMHKLLDRVIDPLIADRLQLTVERDADTDTWLVDVSAGEVFPRPLTPQSGVLGKWKWVTRRETATRVVVGGAGQAEAREFALVIDAAREAATNRIREVFVDARMAEAGADLTPDGLQALAEGSAKAGITADLRETSWFRFPSAYRLGDRVLIKIGSLEVEDVITQIDITHNTRDGFRTVPKVGIATADPQERLVRSVQSLAASVRNLEKR